MNCQRVCLAANCMSLLQCNIESLCPPPAPHITTLLKCVLQSQMKILTVSALVPKMESNITISASVKSDNRIKTKQNEIPFKAKKKTP